MRSVAVVLLLSLTAATAPGVSAVPHRVPTRATPPLPGIAAAPTTYLLRLDVAPTTRAYAARRPAGRAPAAAAARRQLSVVTRAQASVAARLPAEATVLYRTHAALAALAVTVPASDPAAADRLAGLPGVASVHPVAAKRAATSYAVRLQGVPAVWTSLGDRGEGVRVGVVDSGIDYTHADFGGAGTVTAYNSARQRGAVAAAPGVFPNAKVVGGYDLVGDDYDPVVGSSTFDDRPRPDPNPLDCIGHGTHVAGAIAGFGVRGDGSRYEGPYDDTTPFPVMRIGPGMAPAAQLFSLRVFGCHGLVSDVVAAAIDRAVDPNGDGSPADRVDVLNLSLVSDFGSAQDGDSVAADAAAQAGVSVVAASGNSGDVRDIGGAPGSARRVLTVANSQDAQTVVDGLTATLGSAAAARYAAQRPSGYDFVARPDLSGPLVAAPAGNPTACAGYPGGTFVGKVVMVRWTQDALECGSAQRGRNLAAAGAVGYVLANSEETFAGGFNGPADLPGMLLARSGADAFRTALAAGRAVRVTGTSAGTVRQLFPAADDRLNDTSSRGVHAAGNLKPDVTAVGTTVFSAATGTGDMGRSLTGTSLSTAMVSGLAALVRSAHPDWTAEMVKSDIVTTADRDVTTHGSAASDPGPAYSPNRVGSGRIRADVALDNHVLAYDADAPGAVSVSFGPVATAVPRTWSRSVTLHNTGGRTTRLALSYRPVLSVPGTVYRISPSDVTIPAGTIRRVRVDLVVRDVAAMTKPVDPTTGPTVPGSGRPRETLAEATGLLVATSRTSGEPSLRLPIYAAPRPAVTFAAPDEQALSTGDLQTGRLRLSGPDLRPGDRNGVDRAARSDQAIVSLAAGFELGATSGRLTRCGAGGGPDCYRLDEERAGDLRYVGITSDASYRDTPRGYVAVVTHEPLRVPASVMVFRVALDVDADGVTDAYLYNTRSDDVPTQDVFVARLVDARTRSVLGEEPLDARTGDVDAAVFDTTAMMLPFSLAALAPYGLDRLHPRIRYGVETFSAYAAARLDRAGVDGTGRPALSADLGSPGLIVQDAAGAGPLVADRSGASLTVRRDLASYTADRGGGLLLLHLHGAPGHQAQVVRLGYAASPRLTVSPARLVRGGRAALRVGVTGSRGLPAPTGRVRVVDARSGATLARGALAEGVARLFVRPRRPGLRALQVVYAGDPTYVGATAAVSRLRVLKAPARVRVRALPPGPASSPLRVRVRVAVRTVLGIPAHGRVVLVSGGRRIAAGRLVRGLAVLTMAATGRPEAVTAVALYAGDTSYRPGVSPPTRVVVRSPAERAHQVGS